MNRVREYTNLGMPHKLAESVTQLAKVGQGLHGHYPHGHAHRLMESSTRNVRWNMIEDFIYHNWLGMLSFETTLPLLAVICCDVGDSVHRDALVTNSNSIFLSAYGDSHNLGCLICRPTDKLK